MDMAFDFQPVYPHHDLLIEVGEVEMAIDGLARCDSDTQQPDLQSRLDSLLEALDHLDV